MVTTTGGYTDGQAATVSACVNLADPTLRGEIAAAVATALGPPGFQPFADAAVLAAIGAAIVRYSAP